MDEVFSDFNLKEKNFSVKTVKRPTIPKNEKIKKEEKDPQTLRKKMFPGLKKNILKSSFSNSGLGKTVYLFFRTKEEGKRVLRQNNRVLFSSLLSVKKIKNLPKESPKPPGKTMALSFFNKMT